MITGSTPISQFPTGTIDNSNAVYPLSVGMPSSPQTIRASLGQTAQFYAGYFQASGTVSDWQNFPGTVSFRGADSPSFSVDATGGITGTIALGAKIKLTHYTSKYFIVTAIGTPSGTVTPMTLYGGTDYALAASGTIASPQYSHLKTPFGFPVTPTKWSVSLTNSGNVTQSSPSGTVYYNLGSLSLVMPIGTWNITFQATGYIDKASPATMIMQFGISTSPTSVSDTSLTGEWAIGSIALLQQPFALSPLPVTRTSKATYYFIGETGTTGVSSLIAKNIVIQFICAYL